MIKDMHIWEGKMPYNEENLPCENRIRAYWQEDGQVHPVMIIYPGGAYHHYGSTEQLPIAEFYYAHGYHALIVYYRLEPHRYPAALADAQRAVKLVRYHADEWHVDPDRVYTIGFSAGGHLCGCVATLPDVCTVLGDGVDAMSARPNGALLGYPVISSDPAIAHMGSFECLLGDRLEELKADLSLEHRVGADTCPCFLWHSMEDNCVPMENSLRFLAALHAGGIPAEGHIYPVGGHGNGLAINVPGESEWPELSLRWLARLTADPVEK